MMNTPEGGYKPPDTLRICTLHGEYRVQEMGTRFDCPWCEVIALQRLCNRAWRWHFNGPLQEAEPFSDIEARGLAPVLKVRA